MYLTDNPIQLSGEKGMNVFNRYIQIFLKVCIKVKLVANNKTNDHFLHY